MSSPYRYYSKRTLIMNTYKYLLMGALLVGTAAPTFAQQDNKAAIEQAAAIIKSNSPSTADQMKQLAKQYKKNPDVLTGIGRVYLEAKDTANAAKFVEMALSRNSKFAPAWILRGDIEVLKDNPGEAAAAYQNAIYFDPKEPQGYYKYAMVQRGVNPEMATSTLENLRKERPDYPVDQLIGHIYYNAQNFVEAEKAYDKVGNILSMDDENITEYGITTWLLGHREKSIDIVSKALTKDARKAAWNRLLFYNYTDLKQADNALAAADKLFNQSDSAHFTGEDYTYYGTALKLAKKYPEAINAFNKALEFNKDNAKQIAVINKNLSDVYLEEGDYDNAVVYFKKTMEGTEQPTLDQLDNLGTLYADIAAKKTQANDAAGAAEAFKQANEAYVKMAELYPNSKNYCNFMCGQIQANLDPDSKKGLAKPYYDALAADLGGKTELNSSQTSMLKQAYLYLMVYAFNVKKDKATAQQFAQKLLGVDPENAIAKQVMSIK